jgi:glucose-6-phosphate isomerase/transaldolase/glucose-6-phosphate isomerase
MTSSDSFSIEAGTVASQIDAAYARLEQLPFADALWSRRLDVWTSDPATQQKIAQRLGWLSVLDFVTPQLERLRGFAEGVRGEGFTDVVLLGMGGSSLAPEVMHQILGVAPGWPRFRMLDSTDPVALREALSHAESSLFILASKSGTTIEPNVMAAEASRRIEAAGHGPWGSRFIAITDENTALHRRALAERFRNVFLNPADIGGRYSALSLFGLVPASLMGVDLDRLLSPARAMADACRAADPRINPGLALGAVMGAAARSGRDKLTLVVPDRLASFGLWVEQLVAESTGKEGTGIVPIANESPLARYGDDRAAVVVHKGEEVPDGFVVERLRASGAPVTTLRMPDAAALGAEFFRWEVATAAAGRLLDINPFDEPNVQQAKDATMALLSAYGAERRLPFPEPHASRNGVRLTLSRAALERLGSDTPERFLRVIGAGDYFGLLAYVPPGDRSWQDALRRLRAEVGARTNCATMLGYGPRYLHSTGQLHKGGPPTGVFVIVSVTHTDDLPIPGEPYSFGVLEMAQALGDFTSLDRAGRRVLHVHLPSFDVSAFDEIAQVMKEAL